MTAAAAVGRLAEPVDMWVLAAAGMPAGPVDKLGALHLAVEAAQRPAVLAA